MITSPLVSIIVPIYNAEKWLLQCIESLLNQSYTNFEVILVNDGSKDSSKTIAENFLKKITKNLFYIVKRMKVLERPGILASTRWHSDNSLAFLFT